MGNNNISLCMTCRHNWECESHGGDRFSHCTVFGDPYRMPCRKDGIPDIAKCNRYDPEEIHKEELNPIEGYGIIKSFDNDNEQDT